LPCLIGTPEIAGGRILDMDNLGAKVSQMSGGHWHRGHL
jgi:ABC-type cobalamin transport system ATPase subunit